jgi:diaminopimelate epimerase
MRFIKMEGLGNDFVLVDGTVDVDPALVVRLCHRRFGIGADGVLRVRTEAGRIRMDYWNADGSSAEMCGNGLRCAARYAFDRGLSPTRLFRILTPVGDRGVDARDEPRVELGPVAITGSLEYRQMSFQAVNVGNPHAVTFVADLSQAPVTQIGKALQKDVEGGTNVEFVMVKQPDRIAMRVWERGIGETLACGSGMVAAAAAALHLGHVGSQVVVEVPGGEGVVELTGDTAWLTGPARYVFEGEIDLKGRG